MDDQKALYIYKEGTNVKDELAVIQAGLIERIQKTSIADGLKNKNTSDEASRGGTLKFKRMQASLVRDYGTARAAGKGDALRAEPVSIKVDRDKEIVEEVEQKDLERYGVAGLVEKRQADHAISMRQYLDKQYFIGLQTAAVTVDLSEHGTDVEARLQELVDHLEGTDNEYVQGVDKELMVITLAPYWFDRIQKTVLTNATNEDGKETYTFMGVEVVRAFGQTVDAVIQVRGSMAQPVSASEYAVYHPDFSDSNAMQIFFYFGVGAVMPDLIFKGALSDDENISV